MTPKNGAPAAQAIDCPKQQRRLFTDRAACLERGYWTTGSAAKLLGIANQTICELVDSGALRGYRVQRDRRILTSELARYCRQQGMHHLLPLLAGSTLELSLVVGVCALPTGWAALLLDLLPAGWAVASLPTLYHAGRTGGHVLVLGADLGRWQLLDLARFLVLEPHAPALVGLASEDDGDTDGWLEAGFREVLRMPCAPTELAEAIMRAGKPRRGT